MSIEALLAWLKQNYATISLKTECSKRYPPWPNQSDMVRQVPFIGEKPHPYAVGKLAARILKREGYPEVVQKAGALAGACHDIGKNHEDILPHPINPDGEWEPEFRKLYTKGHSLKATEMLERVANFGRSESIRDLKRLVGNLHHVHHSDVLKLGLQQTVVDIVAAVKVADYYHGRVEDPDRQSKWITPLQCAEKLREGVVEGRFQEKAVESLLPMKLGTRKRTSASKSLIRRSLPREIHAEVMH
jgi:hypothetical protein